MLAVPLVAVLLAVLSAPSPTLATTPPKTPDQQFGHACQFGYTRKCGVHLTISTRGSICDG